MPTYNFLNTETGEEFQEFFGMSAKDDYLAKNPHIQQTPSLVALTSGSSLGVRRIDNGFKDVLGKISKDSPKNNMNL